MGRIGHGLKKALEPFVRHFIDGQCKDDWEGETNQQLVHTDSKGVPQEPPEVVTVEEPFEVPQPHPRAPRDAPRGHEVLKRDLHTVHGVVMKDHEIRYYRQNQEV